MAEDEERIALFIDYENLAIGARDRGEKLDMAVIMDALSERGRVVARRAYADWNLFSDYRQGLLGQRIEMIEIPQRAGTVRKNAADIKLAVDALELAFQRDFVTTFVVGSGDSDFTPLVLKLRELNKRVIGVGVEGSARSAPRKHKQQDDSEDEARSELSEVYRLVTRTLAGLQRSGNSPVLSSSIKRAIKRKDPTFEEGDYGFR